MARKNTLDDAVENAKSSRKARGLRLESLRQSLRLSRPAFAEKLGISTYTLQNWEINKNNGLPENRAHEVVQLLRQLGVNCTLEWLLHGIEPAPTIADPLLTLRVHDNMDDLLKPHFQNNEMLHIAEELQLFRNHYPKNTTIDKIVEDNGMEPYCFIGDYVAGVRLANQHFDQAIGKHCIVQTSQGDILVRLIKKGSMPGHYTLSCINNNTSVNKPIIYDNAIVLVAPILWIRRKSNG